MARRPHIIGYRRNGCPIWAIQGGSPEDQGSEGSGSSSEGTQGGDSGDSSKDGAGNGTDSSTEGQETDFDSLPDATKAEIRTLRRENKALRRNQLKEGEKGKDGPNGGAGELSPEAVATLAKLLGLEVPAAARTGKTTQDDSATELRAAKVDLAVYRLARPAGADPDAVLDSRSFLREVAELDPADRDFERDIQDAIKAAVAKDERLKVKDGQKKAPGKSGSDLAAGRNGSRETVPLTPHQRLANAYAANSPT